MFRPPMLATAVDEAGFAAALGPIIAEQKYDGIRLLIERHDADDGTPGVRCYSRTGKWPRCVDPIPKHLAGEWFELEPGLYDGELVVPGGISSDVTNLSNQRKLHYVMFDVLESREVNTTILPWNARRHLLESLYPFKESTTPKFTQLASYRHVTSWHEVLQLAGAMWQKGCEGLILKRTDAKYSVGKRTRDFMKVKEWACQLTTIIGFTPTTGEVMQRGNFACTVVEDGDANTTVVKTLDDETIAHIEAAMPKVQEYEWKTITLTAGRKIDVIVNHPWVGKGLFIEYQPRTDNGRTVNGVYNHPHWDHLEGE